MMRYPFLSAVAASALALLAGCVSLGGGGFGGSGCRAVYVLTNTGVRPSNTCGDLPRDDFSGQPMARLVGPVAGLPELLAAVKFEADGYYTGVDTPADKAPLTKIVDDAVRDLIAMAEPRGEAQVRARLAQAVTALGGFATEDREHGHMYLVLAWRAAGFAGESGLTAVPDEQVLGVF
jgi:hypothetical protein